MIYIIIIFHYIIILSIFLLLLLLRLLLSYTFIINFNISTALGMMLFYNKILIYNVLPLVDDIYKSSICLIIRYPSMV